MRNIFMSFVLVFSIFFLFSCGSDSPGILSGTINLSLIDEFPEDDLGGTTIKMVGKNETAVTDSEGGFTLKEISPGTHTFTISHEDYDTVEVEIEIKSSKVEVYEKTLEYSFGILRGAVSYADFKSYEKYEADKYESCTVTLSKDGENDTKEAGSEGKYSFEKVAPGDYSLSFSGDGYDDYSFDLTVEKNSVKEITPDTELSFNEGGISGLVKNISAEDDSGFNVSLYDKTDSLLVEEFITESDGVFEFFFIPEGDYTLQVKRDNFADFEVDVEIKRKEIVEFTGDDSVEMEALDISGVNSTIDESHEGTPKEVTNLTTAEFSFSSSPSGATFECEVDEDDDWKSCTSPESITELKDGEHTFRVRAILDGKTEETPAEYKWTVDTVDPVITITGKPALLTNLKNSDFLFVADEEVSFQCKLDSESYSDCESPKKYTALSAGEHTFYVTAEDLAGNSSEVSYSWEIVEGDGWNKISAWIGSDAVCGIKLDSTLWCWTSQISPAKIGTDGGWISVTVMDDNKCGIKSDGSLWCWGDNTYGQIGDGTNSVRAEPTKIGEDSWKEVLLVTADTTLDGVKTCGLKSNGELWCWGNVADGVQKNEPTKVTDDLFNKIYRGGVKYISVYRDFFLEKQDRSIVVFSGEDNIEAAPIFEGDDCSFISTSKVKMYSHVCKITDDKILSCYGENNFGELGDGSFTDSDSSFVQAGIDKWISVETSDHLSFGVKEDGTLWAWGKGYGSTAVQITTDSNVKSISQTGKEGLSLLILKDDGTLDLFTKNFAKTPDSIYGLRGTDIEKVTSGEGFSCSLKTDGTIWCWGANSLGELGNELEFDSDLPINAGGDSDWIDLSSGFNHSCARKIDNSLYCWGYSGTIESDLNVKQSGTDWASSTQGLNHTCGLKTNGELWCWGSNTSGQIGDGTNIKVNFPKRVGSDLWKKVVAGENHTCAIKSDDTLWCWGGNSYSQLGDSNNDSKNSPEAVQGSSFWKDISISSNFSCGIDSNDKLYCWGLNNGGQLGVPGGSNSNTPLDVDFLYKSISTGGQHGCGVKIDGTLFCWGNNLYYQLGDGTDTHRTAATQIGTDTDWDHLSLGKTHTCGVKTDGSLKCWGEIPGAVQIEEISY